MAAKRQSADQSAERDLGRTQLETLIVHLVRIDRLFVLARKMLIPSFFYSSEASYKLLWLCLCEVHDEHGSISHNVLREAVESKFELEPGLVDEDAWCDLLGPDAVFDNPDDLDIDDEQKVSLIDYAFSVPEDSLSEAYSKKLLSRFVKYRGTMTPLKTLFDAAGRPISGRLEQMLLDLNKAIESATSLTTTNIHKPLPDDDEDIQPAVTTFTTGVGYLDSFTGGQAASEIYTVVGPTGGGKTATGVKICSSAAVYFSQQERDHGADKRVAVYVTYEEGRAKIANRMMALLGRISKTKLDSLTSINQLNSDTYDKYEQDRWGHLITEGIFPCEIDRYRNIKPLINDYIRIVDFSGEEGLSGGFGGIDELAANLASIHEETPIGVVVIDYVGLCVGNYMEANKIHNAEKTSQIGAFGQGVKRKIASRFKCPTWLLHQMTGAVVNSSPARIPSTSDAAECKLLHQNAAFAFAIGTMDSKSKVFIFACDKARRTGKAHTHTLLRLDGMMADIHHVESSYEIDKVGRKIVEKRSSAVFAGEARPRSADSVTARRRRILSVDDINEGG